MTGVTAPEERCAASFVDDVLDAVDLVPPGSVASYGDIAEFVGRGGPRQVAQVMSLHGGAVPWWRIVRADGSLAAPVADRARRLLEAEKAPFRGMRVDMDRARWDGRDPNVIVD